MFLHVLVELQFLFSSLVALFLVLGCGGSFLWFAPSFNSNSLSIFGALGLLEVGMLSIISNFFVKLDTSFFALLTMISFFGWIKLVKKTKVNDIFLFTGVAIFYWVAGLRAGSTFDTSLYHIPMIRWMHESNLPFGLANLHSRFGFWNFWFSICGGVSSGGVLPYGVFTLNIVLVTYALTDFIRFATNAVVSKNTWFCISILILISLVDFRTFSMGQKSPNADFAGVVLALWSASYLLMRSEERFNWKVPVLLLSGLSILIKLNQAYLGLAILLVIASSFKKFKMEMRTLIVPVGMIAVAALLMILKSFWLSGCLVFPVKSTCFPVSWRVSDGMNHDLVYWIMRWARNAGDPEAGVFNYWAWVPTWWNSNSTAKIISSTLGLSAVWLIAKAALRKKLQTPDLLTLGIFGCGTAYWFLTAPDLRFGYGGFAVIFCLFLGIFLNQYFSRFKKPVLIGVGISLTLSCVGQIIRADDFGASTLLGKSGVIVPKVNAQGQTIYESNECWDSSPPCTPSVDYGVIFIKKGPWTFFEKKL